MDANKVDPAAQQEIVQSISSLALYGFPEIPAASFALIAYASAWLTFQYLGAFTAAFLNNQPMGFYSSAVLVKDAHRHGLRVKPIDILRSDLALHLGGPRRRFIVIAAWSAFRSWTQREKRERNCCGKGGSPLHLD